MTPHSHPVRSHLGGFVAVLPRDAALAQSLPCAGATYSTASGQPEPAATSAMSQLPGATVPGFSAAYRELLRQRAFAQATYERHALLRQSQATEAARKRLWAATCAVLAYEVQQ